MVLAPFKKQDTQKSFGVVTLIVGLILIMVSLPFFLKLGGYSVAGISVGGSLALIGLIYFIEAIA